MIPHTHLSFLQNWDRAPISKPLLICGARRTGKTTLVHQFAKSFRHFISLDLNQDTLQIPPRSGNTLLFFDDIFPLQENLNKLLSIAEVYPHCRIIATCSLLPESQPEEFRFLQLRPWSFHCFLKALGEKKALTELETEPQSLPLNENLLRLFHLYALVGGMPEVLDQYVQNRDLSALGRLFERLRTTFLEDVPNYANHPAQIPYLRHVVSSAWAEAGTRFNYHGFGKSQYASREMAASLRNLEKTMLLQLIHPQTTVHLPLLPAVRKSPRLQVLDSGLANHFAGRRTILENHADWVNLEEGVVLKQLIGQELLFQQNQLAFWIRQKKTSLAEIDFLYEFEEKLIPIVIRSGAVGGIKALHIFMDRAHHDLAVRLYAGPVKIEQFQFEGTPVFYLLSLPYYLVSQMDRFLDWFRKRIPALF